jgi:hypothetical protein
MSKRNKGRLPKKAKLVYCEGPHEETFLKHLHQLFKKANVSVRIKTGKGGGAPQLVKDAFNTVGDFAKRILILDNDKPKKEMESARKEAKKLNINLIEHTPCLEAILLSILISGKDFKNKSTKWCKDEFHSKFMKEKDRTDFRPYLKLFSKKILATRRKMIQELDTLIKLFENK